MIVPCSTCEQLDAIGMTLSRLRKDAESFDVICIVSDCLRSLRKISHVSMVPDRRKSMNMTVDKQCEGIQK